MVIRKYKTKDCSFMAKIFYETVHAINKSDYTKEQLDAWATGRVNLEVWDCSFLEHNTLIAEIEDEIVGFADMDKGGYLDRLYIHKDFQRRGIATALIQELELNARKIGVSTFETYASITAKPFFEKQGYIFQVKNHVVRNGIVIVNYKMVKNT